MNELPDDLERALRDLEAEAARRAAGVSAERVASRVLARLRAEPEAAPRVRPLVFTRRWVGLAAAAVLVVVAGTVATRVLRPGADTPVAVPVVALGLDSLSETSLERVLTVTAQVRPQSTEPVQVVDSRTWDDLSEAQLRAVLQAVQQSEGGSL